MASEFLITADEDGVIHFIYDDQLAFLTELGPTETHRASHVEPDGNQWTADMSPVRGPVLGPFALRGDALAAEVAYLKQNVT